MTVNFNAEVLRAGGKAAATYALGLLVHVLACLERGSVDRHDENVGIDRNNELKFVAIHVGGKKMPTSVLLKPARGRGLETMPHVLESRAAFSHAIGCVAG